MSMSTRRITRAALRISTIEGAWAIVHFVPTSGFFFTWFALLLGANDLQLGILSAIPALCQVFQLAGAYLVEKTGHRKPIVRWFSVVSRTFWLPIALVPFVCDTHAVQIFIGLYLLSSIAMNFAAAGWTAWMSALVPPAIRGRYFGERNRIGGLISILVLLAAGILMDRFRFMGWERVGYLTIQFVAVAAGLVCFYLIGKQPDPGYAAEKLPPLGDYLLRPMRDRNFRNLILFSLYWTFAVGVASPFFNAHLDKYMKWSYKSVAVLNVVMTISTILSQRWWGRLVDRYGHKPVLAVTMIGIVHLPFYYAFCPWDLRWPIYTNAVLTGIMWSGFGLATFNLVMHILPEKSRTMFVAVFAALNGVIAFLASYASGWLAHAMEGVRWHLGSLTIINYQVLFVMTALLRIPGLFFLSRVREPEAEPARVLVRDLLLRTYRAIGVAREMFPWPAREGGSGLPKAD